MAEEKPDVRKDIALIMDGVLKGLMSIPFPDQFSEAGEPPTYITMHYCKECKGYHKVKGQA